MTVAGYSIFELAAVTTLVVGALTYSVLSVYYWRERRVRGWSAFAAFTAVCGIAFCVNLLLMMLPDWETPLTAALDLSTGAIPALLLHVVLGKRQRAVRLAFYAVCAAAAGALALDDLDAISVAVRDQLPPVMLAAAAVLGLALLRPSTALERWYRWLLVYTALATGGSLVYRSAVTVLAADNALLAFFCVTLYYQERLIFFDLLIKRGVFFCASLAAVGAVLRIAGVANAVPVALAIGAVLLAAPWLDGRLNGVVDRVFLRRRYSGAAAERLFRNAVEAATSEEDLRARAENCLGEIFQSRATVRFDGEPAAGAMKAGPAAVEGRGPGIPFMSDDRRLFESLAATLAVVLENVRFRSEQQQLRLLASRAELKALRAQIDPHFLFNALNAIAGLIAADPVLADRTVEELANVFRYTLRRSQSEWVRLDEEAEFIRAYLRVEEARFGERLRVEIAIDDDAGKATIPAMCIQPLIENAVKHGASEAEHGGVVKLRAAVRDGRLRIEVEDNGPGFPGGFTLEQSAGHGLRNVAERFRGYYGDRAEVGWSSEAGWTRVWLRAPAEGVATDARAHSG